MTVIILCSFTTWKIRMRRIYCTIWLDALFQYNFVPDKTNLPHLQLQWFIRYNMQECKTMLRLSCPTRTNKKNIVEISEVYNLITFHLKTKCDCIYCTTQWSPFSLCQNNLLGNKYQAAAVESFPRHLTPWVAQYEQFYYVILVPAPAVLWSY